MDHLLDSQLFQIKILVHYTAKMVNTSINSDYSVEEITQVGRKGRSHGHKYDGADFDESMVCLIAFIPDGGPQEVTKT